MVMKFDHAKKTVRLSLKAKELLTELQKPEVEGGEAARPLKSLWRPEYASYMIEGTPGNLKKVEKYTVVPSPIFQGVPYGGLIDDFNEVEKNMRHRREEVFFPFKFYLS